MFHQIQSRPYGLIDRSKLYNLARGNVDFIRRLKLDRKIEVHNGCVNTICWNEQGSCLLSGSDDQHLALTNPYTGKTLYNIRSGHRANIFSAKFLPSSQDGHLISCSGDGKIYFTDVHRDDTYGTNLFDCHFGTAYEVIVVPNEASTFLSCGEDGTVRFFDLRAKTTCVKNDCKDDVLINCRRAVTSIASNPILPWQLGIACSDSCVRIYDRRMLGTRATGNYSGRGITGLICSFIPPSLEGRSYRITSLNYSPDGEDVLVSYSSEHLYIFGTKDPSRSMSLTKASPVHKELVDLDVDACDHSVRPSSSTGISTGSPTGASPRSSLANLPSTSSGGSSQQPPVKRLRLRGDWSDTGPSARPERERQDPSTSPSEATPPAGERRDAHATIMQRMSDMLTRWLDGNLRPPATGEAPTEAGSSEEQTGSTSATDNPEPAAVSEESMEAQSVGSRDSNSGNTVDAGAMSEETAEVQEPVEVGGDSTLTFTLVASSDGADSTSQQMESNDTGVATALAGELPQPAIPAISVSSGDMDTDECETKQAIEVGSAAGSMTADTEVAALDTKCQSESVPDSVDEKSTDDPEGLLYNPLYPTSYVKQKLDLAGGHQTPGNTDNIDKCSDDSSEKPVICRDGDIKEVTTPDVGTSTTTTADSDAATSSSAENRSTASVRQYQDIRQVMNAAVETLRNRQLEPVISLQYSSEGTSTSTITLGLTPIDTAVGGGGSHSRNPETQSVQERQSNRTDSVAPMDISESGNNLSSVSPLSQIGTGSTGSETCSNIQSCSESNVEETASGSIESFVTSRVEKETRRSENQDSNFDLNVGHVHCDSVTVNTQLDTEMVVETGDGKGIVDPVASIVQKTDSIEPAGSCVEMNELSCAHGDKWETMPIANSKLSNLGSSSEAGGAFCELPTVSSSLVDTDSCTTTKDSQTILPCEVEQLSNDLSVPDKQEDCVLPSQFIPVETVDKSADVSAASRTPAPGEVVADSGGLGTPGSRVECRPCGVVINTDSAIEGEVQTGETDVTSSVTEPQHRREGISALRDLRPDSPVPRETTRPGSGSQRQRRLGHSGPPTGTFQLGDSDDSTGSDNDDDTGTSGPQLQRSQLIRTTAARRLQALCRKRQDQKEKEEMALKNIYQPTFKAKFKGHRNARTMIKESSFWGNHFVLSGSDCGHVFIWDRYTSKAVMLLEADRHVVNCIQPHPYDTVLASSGIDYDIKLWAPLQDTPTYDEESAQEEWVIVASKYTSEVLDICHEPKLERWRLHVMGDKWVTDGLYALKLVNDPHRLIRRNEIMLEETRDTITVPAAFMLRVLASLNHIRSGRRAQGNHGNQDENPSSSDSDP